MSAPPLPTPGEAMRQAIERAQLGDIEGGNLWLGIARELRLGASPAGPIPRPLERSELTAEADLATAGLMTLSGQLADTPLARHAAYEAGLISVPAERPAASDETAVLRYPEGDAPGERFPRCGHCGHAVELNLEQVPALWVHVMTRQAVCPISQPDQQHTYAQPEVDARG